MKRILSTLNKNKRTGSRSEEPTPFSNSPEGNALNGVKLFCESGGPTSGGDDVLHLPGIVDAAESSPSAAREAAQQIRIYLSKDFLNRAHVQYNALMLVRILADNPGPTFTRNVDAKFVQTVKDLLRHTQDPSLLQLVKETLDALATDKQADENLALLREMWAKEKEKIAKHYATSGSAQPQSQNTGITGDAQRQQNYFARQHRSKGLPPPHELAARIEEAKTSAKLLLQVVQSTPPGEYLGNDLIKEFAERCQSASRSVQVYISAANPAPDIDTLLTLIETNEQLTLAMSKHNRAVLQARRALSAQMTSPDMSLPPFPQPQPQQQQQVSAVPTGAQTEHQRVDPFGDENQAGQQNLQTPLQPGLQGQRPYKPVTADQPYPSPPIPPQAHSQEPYHPGFGYGHPAQPMSVQPTASQQSPANYRTRPDDADYYYNSGSPVTPSDYGDRDAPTRQNENYPGTHGAVGARP